MKPILIVYATREGHSRKIAEHLAAAARARGLQADVVNAAVVAYSFSISGYGAAILCASVHMEKHEREMVAFARKYKNELEAIRSVFISVSLTETTAESDTASPETKARAHAAVEHLIHEFLEQTGWHPSKVQAAAGALLYTKYNFLVRFIMRRIAQKVGGDTDTSRDFEYTDWEALDRVVDEVMAA